MTTNNACIAGVVKFVAKSVKQNDNVYPQLRGIARVKLIGWIDAVERQQSDGIIADYWNSFLDNCPDFVQLLDIGVHSENSKRIYEKVYKVPYIIGEL